MASRSRSPLFTPQPSPQANNGRPRVDNAAMSRVHDYTMKYPPDKPGEEHKENARVWNIYLDEAENFNRDMLQGFRDIIDGVLIFASLFSAVVTTVVVQTSQVLQPDNTQITISILSETNQLLRAAGNVTSINSVPKAMLSPVSVVHKSKDVWVNALFFASLGLSLSTALLTVLVKQWLHAYSAYITGDAQHRALVTHFRSEGLRTWRMRQIVETLPLILHGSVLIFFVGLVLYVSQLSTLICGILASITVLAFTFYVGSSFLPSVFPACPYRIPFLLNVGHGVLISLYAIALAVLSLLCEARAFFPQWLSYLLVRKRLKVYKQSTERREGVKAPWSANTPLNILEHLLQTSSQRSTRQVVYDAVIAMLREYEAPKERDSVASQLRQPFQHQHPFLRDIFRVSLSEFVALMPNASDATVARGMLPPNFYVLPNRIDFLNGRIVIESDRISLLLNAYRNADLHGNVYACNYILKWIGHTALHDTSNACALLDILTECTASGIRRILIHHSEPIFSTRAERNESLLHVVVRHANIDAVKAVVENDRSNVVLNSTSEDGKTPLDVALAPSYPASQYACYPEIVRYLMDHGARASHISYEFAFLTAIKLSQWPMIHLLWNKRKEVGIIDVRPDSWCTKSPTDIANSMPLLEESKRLEFIQVLQERDEASSSGRGEPLDMSTPSRSTDEHPSQTEASSSSRGEPLDMSTPSSRSTDEHPSQTEATVIQSIHQENLLGQ